jgi:hypothetical protein
MGLISKHTLTKMVPDVRAKFYWNPSDTTNRIAHGLDQKRATIFEWPILWFSTAYLYHRGFVRNSEGQFGLGDFVLVTIVSYALKYFAVGRRWEGM